MAAAGWDGERGRRLPSAAQLPAPGWKPAQKKEKNLLSRSYISKGEIEKKDE